jgi:type 1 glutamine amidotransferase
LASVTYLSITQIPSEKANPQKTMKILPALLLCAGLLSASASAQSQKKPLRILLITGGCCHDYAKQKDILKEGLEKRVGAEIVQVHSDDKSVKPPLAIFGNPDYAKGFDLIIHDECAAGINDESVVRGVLKPHDEGIPGVNLHCAMHSYRIGNAGDPVELGTPHGLWFEYLGLQSTGHGPQEPIAITHIDKNSPLSKNLPDWSTVKEELYNNLRVFDTATPVARGKQITKAKDGTEKESDVVVAWTNLHKAKTRVFSTTIGHNNATVEDDRYLDFVARGILWAAGRLGSDGAAASSK